MRIMEIPFKRVLSIKIKISLKNITLKFFSKHKRLRLNVIPFIFIKINENILQVKSVHLFSNSHISKNLI